MKPKYALRSFLVVCQFSMVSMPTRAATLNWDSNAGTAPVAFDGAGTWTTANSFHNGTGNVTWTNGTDIAAFGNTASNPVGIPGAIAFTTGVTAGGMIFNPYFGNATKYNISGGTGGVLTLSGAPAIAVNTNSARPFAAINAILAGTAGFDVTTTTAGILEIGTQANTITGTVRLKNGSSFSIGGDTSFGGTGNGLTFSDASATLITRANTTVAAARAITISAGNTARFDSINGATLTLSPTGGITGAGSSLQKEGLGGLTLGSSNSFTGQTRVRQGTLTLDFVNAAAPVSSIIPVTSPLRLYGGALSVVGKTVTNNTQAFAGLTLDPGASSLSVTPGATAGFTTTLNLGNITRNPGSTVNISVPVAGGGTVSYLAGNSNTNNILGGYATVGGADWAAVSGGSLIALPSYQTGTDATLWVPADNVTLAADPTTQPVADTTINSLRLTAAANVTVPGGNTLVLSSGGLLVNGAGAETISGGTLKGSASGDLVVIQNSSDLTTISSVIANNGGATGLTKSGSGPLVLTGTNTYSGNTWLNAGSLDANSDAALGTGSAITSRAGTTLTLSGGSAISSSKNFIFDFGSDSYGANTLVGTATDVGNFNLNVTNTAGTTISGAFNVSGGTLVKKGIGALTLTNPGINQLARLNGGTALAFEVLEGSVTFNGGVSSEWRVGQAEFQVGLGDNATSASARKAVVNVNSGAITVGSWTGISRGNGIANLDSKIAMTGGTWDTGNVSLGFANGVTGFAAKPILDLSGTSVFTVRDLANLSESGGSDATVNLANTSQLRVRNNIAAAGGGNSKLTVNQSGGTIVSGGSLTAGGGSGATAVFNLSGTSSMTTTGSMRLGNAAGASGTLNLSGNSVSTVGSFLSIGAPGTGAVSVQDSAAFSAATDFNIADTDGSRGTLNLSGGTVTAVNLFLGKGSNVAGDLNTNGAVNQSGGTFGSTGTAEWRIGGNAVNDNEVYASYAISGGALNYGNRNFQIGAFGRAVLDISGTGAVTGTGGTPVIGRQTNGNGVVNVSGGSYTFTGTGNLFIVGENGKGTVNVSGTGTLNLNGGLRVGHAAGGVGLANLDGGTVNTRSISFAAGTSGSIYLNGSLIKPLIANTGFFTGLSRAIVGPGAAKFDTNGLDITVGQVMSPPTGSGVTAVAVTNSGAGYIGQPIVQFTGGGGSDAAATATVSGGVVTGIVITNPGTGYSGTPTVSLVGGGPTTAATLGTVSTAAVAADGGLQKSGAGILTLTGASTYTGTTLVTAGTLALGVDNVIGDSSPLTVNGGIFSTGGSSDTVGPVTLTSGSISGTGTLTGSSFSVDNASGTLTISAPLGGSGVNLTKTGAGTLALTAENFYTGVTTVSGGGTLSLGTAGALNSASSLTLNASTLDLRNGSSNRAQFVNNLTLNAATLLVGMTGSSTDMLNVAGTTSATGVTTVKLIGSVNNGTYDILISATPLSNPNFTLDTTGALAGFTTYTGAVVGNIYRLTAAGIATPGDAWWKGDVSAIWTDASLAPANSNWATNAGGGTDTQQLPGGSTSVHFSATGAGNTATTLGANISIGSLTFESGTASVTGGASTLSILSVNGDNYPLEVKSGASAALNSTMTFTGKTMINAGGTLTVSGGTLGAVTDEIGVDGTLNVNGDVTKGVLSGNGIISKTLAGVSTFTVGDSTFQVFPGKIENPTGTLNFTKAGTGDLLLSGTANTFSGALKIAGGRLEIDNTGALGNPSALIQQPGSTFINSVGNLTISAPYSFDLNGGANTAIPQTVLGNDNGSYNLVLAAGTTTLSGLVSNNGGSLAKRGPGTLAITNPGANVLAGNTGIAFALQEGNMILNGGPSASYAVTGGEMIVGDITGNQTSLTLSSGTLTVGQFVSVGRGNGSTALQSTLNLNGGTLAVPNLYSGFASITAGYNARPVINLNGSTVNITAARIGESVASYGTLNLNSGALTATGTVQVGHGGTGVATCNMPVSVGNLQLGSAANGVGIFYNNSTVTGTGGSSTNNFPIGNGSNSYGYFRNNAGGSATFAEIGVGGAGGGGAATSGGVLDIAGGSVTATTWFTPNRSDGTLGQNCLVNVTGGNLNTPNSGQFRVNTTANADQHAVINVSGTGSIIGSGAASTMNLNSPVGNSYGMLTIGTGGTVQLTGVLSTGDAGHAFVNLNGGTLKAGATAPALLAATVTGYLQSAGATVDTNTFDATIQAPLLAPATAGVTAIALGTQGAGYLGRPLVRIAGDGVGATAVADFDPITGVVSGITVTSPGSGYNSLPTVSLIGGGGTTTAVVGGVTLGVAASNGGLTKTGTGTLTLSAANTYTGNTTVSAGGLALADNAQLKFVIGANHVNNAIGGTGTLTLDGDFVIDTAGANLTNGNTWTLVDVGSLAENFTANFSVIGFADMGGNIWQKVSGANTWTFSEATGILTLTVSSGYASWESSYSLGTNSEQGDPDNDGIKNLMEYLLGGIPVGAGASNTSILPTQALNATNLVVTFRRSDISEIDTTVKVQWSTDMTTWFDFVTIGAGDALPAVDVTEDVPTAAIDTVVVTIPRTGHEVGGKLFARVKAVK